MWYSHQPSFSAIRRLKLIQRKSLRARQHCSNFLWERGLNKTLQGPHTHKRSVLLNVFVHTLKPVVQITWQCTRATSKCGWRLAVRQRKKNCHEINEQTLNARLQYFNSRPGTDLTFSWNRRKIYFALQKMRRSSVTLGEPFQNSIAPFHKKCNTFLGGT